MVKLTHQLVSM